MPPVVGNAMSNTHLQPPRHQTANRSEAAICFRFPVIELMIDGDIIYDSEIFCQQSKYSRIEIRGWRWNIMTSRYWLRNYDYARALDFKRYFYAYWHAYKAPFIGILHWLAVQTYLRWNALIYSDFARLWFSMILLLTFISALCRRKINIDAAPLISYFFSFC